MRAAGQPETTLYLRSYHMRRFASETGRAPFPMTVDFLAGYLGGHAKLGASSRNSMRSSLRAFYRWAHLTGRIDTDPSASLPKVKVQTGRPRPAPTKAVDEGKRAHDWRVRLMVNLAAHAGMRCGEIAKAHTDDVFPDLVGSSILVHGKGGKERTVPLRDELEHMLKQLEPGYIFPGRIDGHLSPGYVSKLISEALPTNVTGHMLRHWFATNAYRGSGGDIRAVQELLGHASVATTQIYTLVEDGATRRAVNF
ncbi:site-specific recombinase XerD [Microterricola gilva]|uniref:Site-specific recombinase XerD n=2 Tax=Microterricola gilva TaxID=393267 RepID=A0A4Q8AJJ5_9MICO|nr:site-specific recombinase XerD [Microterricola gilva]